MSEQPLERVSSFEAKQALLDEALRVVTEEPESSKPGEKQPPKTASQHVREAAAEELVKERPEHEGDLNARVEARRDIFERASHVLAPGRGRRELERQMNAHEQGPNPDTAEKPAESTSRPAEPGTDWSSLYAGMSAEELEAAQKALIDAQVAVETEHLSPADFAYEPGVEDAVLEEDEDTELDSLPSWTPGGSDYEGEDDDGY